MEDIFEKWKREKKSFFFVYPSVLILILSRILAFYGVEINYRHRMMQYIFLPRPMFNMRHLTRLKFSSSFLFFCRMRKMGGHVKSWLLYPDISWQIFIVRFDPFRCKGNLMSLNEVPYILFNLFSFQRQIYGDLVELRGFKGWVYS